MEVVSINNYQKELEYNTIRENKNRKKYNNLLLTIEIIIGLLSVLTILGSLSIVTFIPMRSSLQTLLIVVGMIAGWSGVILCLVIEQRSENYECQRCKYKYIPSFWQVFWSKNNDNKRYMKCPICEEASWHLKTRANDMDQPFLNKKSLTIEIGAIVILVTAFVIILLNII